MTVSDRKKGVDDGSGQIAYYEAEVLSASDYYPFGFSMPGRIDLNKYRFGFNGKENDSEWGSQVIQDYGFRIYNPSIGKFLSVDPLAKGYPMLTPYQFASNRPIDGVDLDGKEWKWTALKFLEGQLLGTNRLQKIEDGAINRAIHNIKGLAHMPAAIGMIHDRISQTMAAHPTTFCISGNCDQSFNQQMAINQAIIQTMATAIYEDAKELVVKAANGD